MEQHVLVPVYRRKVVWAHALVDAADAERVAGHRWVRCGAYASTWINGRTVLMHRFILGLPHGERFVHHVNEEPLDNRRENLEHYATASEANARPHPRRDAAARAGANRYAEQQRLMRLAERTTV